VVELEFLKKTKLVIDPCGKEFKLTLLDAQRKPTPIKKLPSDFQYSWVRSKVLIDTLKEKTGCSKEDIVTKLEEIGSKIVLNGKNQTFGKPSPGAVEGEEAEPTQETTVYGNGFLAEEIFDGTTPRFQVYHFEKGEFETANQLPSGEKDDNGQEIFITPVDNDQLRKGLVVLPSGITETTFSEVIDEVFDFLIKGSRFDSCGHEDEVKLNGLFAVGSWFLDKMKPKLPVKIAGIGVFAPILAIRGPSGSGKNRLANLLRLISYKPYFDMSKTKIPSLYRPLDVWKGTLVMDEADFDKTTETSDVIHYLNCRAQGTPISRQNPESPKTGQAFDDFGITILTQRRPFDDNATEGRTIPFFCEKTDEKMPTVEIDDTIKKGLALQNKLLYLRLRYWDEFEIDKAAWIEDISDYRLNSALLPLLAIGKFEPRVLEIITNVVKKLEEKRKRLKANSPDGMIVNYIWEKIEIKLTDVHSIYHYLLEEAEHYDDTTKKTTTETRPLTTSKIADALHWKPAGIRKLIASLNMAPETAPHVIKVEGRTYKPIFFDPKKLEKLLREFVVEYTKDDLKSCIKEIGQTKLGAN
jgi:hypothetical protein